MPEHRDLLRIITAFALLALLIGLMSAAAIWGWR